MGAKRTSVAHVDSGSTSVHDLPVCGLGLLPTMLGIFHVSGRRRTYVSDGDGWPMVAPERLHRGGDLDLRKRLWPSMCVAQRRRPCVPDGDQAAAPSCRRWA
jgi:hypothetical protein